ncbi:MULTISPECIES: S8 family serine peptidase [unclassified Ruegeria]|uniref:S8 family serine peptidase n=1 Tax=unclassified Ruegeria TaxID=2625375 RepID=UPI00209D4156|nr:MULTISPECIES: S8 family serine peptidase [unclassified Ruegeria]
MTMGQEDYKRYYYLWHLVAIKAITVQTPPASSQGCPEIGSVEWDFPDSKREAHIGLIDMGVAPYHPNLVAPPMSTDTDQILWDKAIDLASHPYGARYVDLGAVPASDRHVEKPVALLASIPTGATIAGLNADERAIVDEIRAGCGVERYVQAYDDRYAAHGTSCAGLTSGTAYIGDQYGNTGNIAAYFGVDPLSKVIPITTSISPSPKELIAAFLYAYAQKVHVILLPRDAADPEHWSGYPSLDANEKTRLHETLPGEPDQDAIDIDASWRLLKKVIEWVSLEIPVVCAAGNDGRSELIYPAKMSSDPNNGVISVGAVSYNAYRSGYSNYSSHLTVVAPSDDGEVYNRHQIRLDRDAAPATDFHWDEDLHKTPGSCTAKIPSVPYASQRLITLDAPGPRGYVEGSLAGPVETRAKAADDPAGLYTEFGGTSGASALVAGVIAMMQRKSANVLKGPAIKGKFTSLTGNSRFDTSHWYWLNGTTSLQQDAINGTPTPPKDDLFGQAGLLDVKLMLSLV